MSIESALADLIESAFKNKLDRVHISVPSTIVKYDASKNTASVKVCSAVRYDNLKELPIIDNVPIMFPQSENSGFVFEVKKGDPVLLVFSDIDISHWVSNGESKYPESLRRFNLNDCYGIVGALKTGKSKLPNDCSAIVFSGDSKIEFKKTGDVLINGHLKVTTK